MISDAQRSKSFALSAKRKAPPMVTRHARLFGTSRPLVFAAKRDGLPGNCGRPGIVADANPPWHETAPPLSTSVDCSDFLWDTHDLRGGEMKRVRLACSEH